MEGILQHSFIFQQATIFFRAKARLIKFRTPYRRTKSKVLGFRISMGCQMLLPQFRVWGFEIWKMLQECHVLLMPDK